jgi:hypothetical protein
MCGLYGIQIEIGKREKKHIITRTLCAVHNLFNIRTNTEAEQNCCEERGSKLESQNKYMYICRYQTEREINKWNE